MTISPPPPPDVPASTGHGRVASLRGAGVDVDVRRVGRVLGVAVLLTLATVTAVLLVAGIHHNDQATRLRRNGVSVTMTVAGCEGLLGGSGSNAAGYQCSGTFTLDGDPHRELLPGSTLYAPGTRIQVVAVPGDPALVATAAAVAHERPSVRAFILPAVLFVILVASTTAAVLVHRQARAGTGPSRRSAGRPAP